MRNRELGCKNTFQADTHAISNHLRRLVLVTKKTIMPDFRIETSGFNRFRDRLDTAIIQLSAQKLYNAIKEKVPEIEMERSSIIFLSVGKELVLSSANLSSQLRHKLQDSGFSFA